jgi:hypothetical protein
MLNPPLPSPSAILPPPFDSIPEATPPAHWPLAPPGTAGRRLKHGLYAQHPVAPGEDQTEFDAFLAHFIADEQPEDDTERLLVTQMVRCSWELERIWGLESGVYKRLMKEHPPEPDDAPNVALARCFIEDNKKGQSLDRLSRHQMRLSNAFHKASRELMLRRKLRMQGLLPRHSKETRSREITESLTTPPTSIAGSSRERSSLGPTSPASSGGDAARDQPTLAARAIDDTPSESSHCLQGEVPRRGGEGCHEAPATLGGEDCRIVFGPALPLVLPLDESPPEHADDIATHAIAQPIPHAPHVPLAAD